MGDVRMDAAQVRALARTMIDAADRIADIDWPTMGSDDMSGSAVGLANPPRVVEDRLADLLAHLRAWAAAAQASANGVEWADERHAGRVGEPP